jgi:hypothetical protein
MPQRFSRPCYDKYHRCPGWNGGGTRSAKVDRCEGGYLSYFTDDRLKRLWRWRFNQCPKCHVIVFPWVIRYVDPMYWWRWKRRDLVRWWEDR